jgi:5-methylcytosine-specific restriction protein A
MPLKAMRMCSHPGCSELTRGARCEVHQRERKQQEYRERENPWLHMYHDPRWNNPDWGLRAQQLRKEPLCAECLKEGRVTVANVVDHVKKHGGDAALFYDPSNLNSLCKRHHDVKTATIDGGFGRKK